VRSKEEILRTLDEDGELDGMPFMPEMLPFCGQRFRIFKRAHKTCDTVFPVRARRVHRAVHLETRCDGQAHGGCQAGCLLFWKEDWLRAVSGPSQETVAVPLQSLTGQKTAPQTLCTESMLSDRTCMPDPEDGSPVYRCQAIRLPYATSNLAWWDLRQYLEDYSSGNVGLWRIFCGLLYSAYYNLSIAGIGIGRPMRWLYDSLRVFRGGKLFPRTFGRVPEGQPTPTATLNLQPGEWVRVKSHEEILRTVDVHSRNRGLWWDAEMVPYCGGMYKVLRRVSKILDEKSGKMREMKGSCLILDSVVCQSRYSGCRMFCPRAIYPYWREIWLERVAPVNSTSTE